MGERRGTKGLELWCRRMTEGYPGVEINNMTTSWRDGLAFCAIIHHFRPDLIDFSKLNKSEIYKNNLMAFQIAESHLGIPALLEPDDMVKFEVPDRLSILTYLSQFYKTFGVPQGLPTRIVPKRLSNATDRPSSVSPTPSNQSPKVFNQSSDIVPRKSCFSCGLPVVNAERFHVNNQLYHRTCFTCVLCNNQLTLANYSNTDVENKFCCVTCPDKKQSTSIERLEEPIDLYSDILETVLEDTKDISLSKRYTIKVDETDKWIEARSHFITSQLDDSDSDTVDVPESALTVDEESLDVTKSMSNNNDLNLVDHSKDNTYVSYSDFCDNLDYVNVSNSVSNQPKTAPHIIEEDLTSSINESVAVINDNICKNETPNVIDQKEILTISSSVSNQPQAALHITEDTSSINENVVVMNESETYKEEKCEDVSDTPEVIQQKEISTISNSVSNQPQAAQHITEDTSSINENVVVTNESETYKEENCEDVLDTPEVIQQKEILTISNSVSNQPQSEETSSINRNVVAINDSIRRSETYAEEDVSDTPGIIDQKEISIITISSTDDENVFESPADLSKVTNEDISVVLISSDDNTKNSEDIFSDTNTPGLGEHENKDYPKHLNPFEDEDEANVNVSLNPFGSDEDDDEESSTMPSVRKRISVRGVSSVSPYLYTERISVNPHENINKSPVVHTRKFLKAPKFSFDYDFFNKSKADKEGNSDSDSDAEKPMPLYETVQGAPNPTSRKFGLHSSTPGSNTHSSTEVQRHKKRRAPQPPTISQGSGQSSLSSTPCTSAQQSPKLPRVRKSRKAPTPFCASTIPVNTSGSPNYYDELEIKTVKDNSDQEKDIKDKTNRNRQSQIVTDILESSFKTTYIKQHRRSKGPAPSRPLPQKRTLEPFPLQELKDELDTIEIQLQGLEKQGAYIEELIRANCDIRNNSFSSEVDDLALDLFDVVNERTILIRKQSELMYLLRQHRLEEEHAELEYQIRCLLLVPEHNKTDCDKTREEELMKRLYEIVEQRNKIVECLEMDRIRESKEDEIITHQSTLYSSQDSSKVKSAKKVSKK